MKAFHRKELQQEKLQQCAFFGALAVRCLLNWNKVLESQGINTLKMTVSTCKIICGLFGFEPSRYTILRCGISLVWYHFLLDFFLLFTCLHLAKRSPRRILFRLSLTQPHQKVESDGVIVDIKKQSNQEIET